MPDKNTNRSDLRVTVAQIGPRRHYAVPRIFQQRGLLELFYTDLCANPLWIQAACRLVPQRFQPDRMKRLAARMVTGIPNEKIRSFPRLGLQMAFRSGDQKPTHEMVTRWAHKNATFCRKAVGRGLGLCNAVYVFNGAGLEILQEAKKRSLFRVLDQTAPPAEFEERLIATERKHWPGWDLETEAETDWAPLAERERKEWELAELILCGSDLVRTGVEAEKGPAHRCAVIPYGIDAARIRTIPRQRTGRPLRVLYLGTLQLRKGIPYVLEAAKLLKKDTATFRAVGSIRITNQAVSELRSTVEVIGPIPRGEIQQTFNWADVLLLPTLSEGSANVCYEALANGIPVITTPHAGSTIRDGLDGFIVPLRSPQAIAEKIALIAENSDLLEQYSRNALERARQFTWDQYGLRLLEAIETQRGRHG